MTQRKKLDGALASWHPHPKDSNPSLVPVVRDAGAADEIADRFFDSASHLNAPEPATVEVSAKRVALESSAVRARRRYLMRYVAGTVSVAGLIGLAAIVRMTTTSDAAASSGFMRSSAATVVAASAPDTAPVMTTTMVGSIPQDPPAIAVVAPSESAVAAPSESAIAAPTESANVAPSSESAPVVETAQPVAPAATAQALEAPADAPAEHESAANTGVDPHAAEHAKRASQHALDRGRFTKAIEAGERSVSIDPTDAEAWLILGAAYQAKGRDADARRCFSTCAHKAKRGPRSECRALLR